MQRPLWISHRGLCEGLTENTAEAFRKAREAGFSHLETDLRMTKDGHIVFSHDKDLRRLTGQAIVLSRETKATLQDIRFPDGSGLLFWEGWEALSDKTAWTFDLKAEDAPAVIDFLAGWMESNGKEDFIRHRVRFVCWSKAHEEQLRQRIPFACCYARRFECYRAGIACLVGATGLAGLRRDRVYALPPRLAGIPLFRKPILDRYHRRGAKVVAFLPPAGKDSRNAVELGCDEILTNHRPVPPDKAEAQ